MSMFHICRASRDNHNFFISVFLDSDTYYNYLRTIVQFIKISEVNFHKRVYGEACGVGNQQRTR